MLNTSKILLKFDYVKISFCEKSRLHHYNKGVYHLTRLCSNVPSQGLTTIFKEWKTLQEREWRATTFYPLAVFTNKES